MRILFLGAGATGGYFGARLAEAGRDVTFLVRPARAEILANAGLNVKSPVGDVAIAAPRTVVAGRVAKPYDVVVLSCKAYDLDAAIADVAPAVGPKTVVLPLLNGLRHLSVLDDTFGADAVLGGLCVISTTLAPDGGIIHLNATDSLTYGARSPAQTDAVAQLQDVFSGTKVNATLSPDVTLAMWEKWVVLSAMAGATCLMRAPIGAINRSPGGTDFVVGLIDEVRAVAEASGARPREAFLQETRAFLTDREIAQTSSMFRDIAAGSRIEADHIIGDLLQRGAAAGLACPRLTTAYCHLKAYEAQRQA